MDTPRDVPSIRSPREADVSMDLDLGGDGGGGGGGAPAPRAAVAPPAAPARYPIPSRSYQLAPRPGHQVKRGYTDWDIDHERFEIKKELGSGSYGKVVQAIDHLTGRKVAIKRIMDIFSVFENAKRIYREVRCLKPPPPPLSPFPPRSFFMPPLPAPRRSRSSPS